MATNFPGPYEVRIFYTVDAAGLGPMEHQLRYSAELTADPVPGAAFSTIDIVLSGGGTLALHTQVNALVALLKPLMSAADCTIDRAELWFYFEESFESNFISTYDIGEAGTHVNDATPANSTIYTFRTRGGGIAKCVLMETTGVDANPVAYADLVTIHKNLVDYIMHESNSPWLARDNTYPFAFLKAFNGSNEHLFKVRYNR